MVHPPIPPASALHNNGVSEWQRNAERAKNEAITLIPNGSANKPQDLKIDQAHVNFLLNKVRNQAPPMNNSNDILRIAKIAVAGKTGNCCELAAVAFTLLFMRGIHPLRYFSYPGGHGDHCFVVVGPEPHGYVCDPWADLVYPESEIPNRMQVLSQSRPFAGEPNPAMRTIITCNRAGSVDQYKSVTASTQAAELMNLAPDAPSLARMPSQGTQGQNLQGQGVQPQGPPRFGPPALGRIPSPVPMTNNSPSQRRAMDIDSGAGKKN